ncbi:NAD(P)-dependent oxidoreductase [Falsiroseomonas oryzae]|uniref:NAD(P)-dependent oxidoreductase n=1 Tax=Falsiroseomonas oryzae TaxID=2766473 RepID=UPI0022EA4B24|nr:NAD(P)-dependent oxidoreductase [Roseomonas sp. MO-31]
MSFDILVTAPTLEPAGRALLDAAGCRLDFVSFEGGRAEMEAKLAARRWDGVISRFLPISAAAMDSCPSLRVISRAAVGVDAIDLPAASARGIAVLTATGANAQSVAEFAIGLMLAAARDIPKHAEASRQGRWEKTPLGLELHGRCLGLVGYGRIAQRVARIALAIGMRVVAWSPRLHLAGDIAPVLRADSLQDLLQQSDVLSLHAPLTAANRGMIGAEALDLLGPEGILVNTARGGLVDEAALAEALRAGRLRSAALDVRPVEPPPAETVLTGVPNLILAPHMGSATTTARAATARAAATHLLDVLLGRPLPPEACVNPEALAR